MRQSLRHLTQATLAASLWSAAALCAHAQDTQVNVVTPAPEEAPSPAPEPVVEPTPAPYQSPAPDLQVNTSAEDPFVDTETTRMTFPNRPLLVTGTTLLVSSYVPAVIVAAAREDTSKNLYYPVAGPWMEIAQEDPNELGKTLLVLDGAFQGLGALAMVSSLVIPERTTKNWYLMGNNRLQVAPRIAHNHVGLGARGTF